MNYMTMDEIERLQQSVGLLMKSTAQTEATSQAMQRWAEMQTQASAERLARLREEQARLMVNAYTDGLFDTSRLNIEPQCSLRKPKKKTLLQRFKELLAKAKGEPMPWDGEVEVMPWEELQKED